MNKLCRFLIVLCFGLMLFYLQPAMASDNPALDFNKITQQLNHIEQSLQSEDFSLQNIEDNTNFLYETSNNIATFKQENEREARFVQKQLDALGDEPADGTKELKVISDKRTEFKNELSILKGRIAEADILQVKIDELNLLILSTRNHMLLGNLVTKQAVLIEPQNFIVAVKDLVQFLWNVTISPIEWYYGLDTSNRGMVLTYLVAIIVILIATFWLGLFLRRLIMKNWGYRPDVENPRYGQKITAAIFVAVAYGVIPALIIGGFLAWMIGSQMFGDTFFSTVLSSFLSYLLGVILARAVARVTFAPYNEKWRLISVSTPKAIGIVHALYLSIILIGAISLLEHLAINIQSSQDLINLLTAAACAIKTFAIILLVSTIFHDEEKTDSAETTTAASESDEDDEDEGMSTSVKVVFFTSVITIGTFGLSLFGYPELSNFILERFIGSALLFGVFFIVHKLISELLRRIFLLGFWAKSFKLRRRMLAKIDFGLSLFLTPLLALFFIFVLLNLWGLSGDAILHTVKKLLFGFNVGGVRISLIAIILGIAVFFGSLALVKIAKNNLTNNVFAKLDIDDGIKHSLSSGVSFIGFVISSLLAIIVMGGNLTSLAVIAGALSVGIGFGLQNIINNFVSGIIILFERPFKVGDWVIFNGEEGQIKQINIRSTELETFKKTSVIIPNATLISSSLTNLTHGNNWTRQSVKIGVAYGSDVDKVTEILLECARNNKKVLKVPTPYVLFQDFGDSALIFELRCYSNNIWAGWVIPSELRYEINRRFIEEGIEIPFPQMVIHQGNTTVETESQFYARKKAAKASANKA